MFSLIHFCFEVIKISILGFLYASVFKFIRRKLSANKESETTIHWKPSLKSWFLISVLLFIYMLSHYGDHGLGDSARIPLHHDNSIQQIDITSYIGYTIIDSFHFTDDFVFGVTHSDTFTKIKQSLYFAYNLQNNHTSQFKSKAEFHTFLLQNNLDTSADLKDFDYHYNKYWRGWRFFLLP